MGRVLPIAMRSRKRMSSRYAYTNKYRLYRPRMRTSRYKRRIPLTLTARPRKYRIFKV